MYRQVVLQPEFFISSGDPKFLWKYLVRQDVQGMCVGAGGACGEIGFMNEKGRFAQ